MTGQALVKSSSTDIDVHGSGDAREFVTFNIAGQLFGIPVLIVQDILLPENIASIPLAPPEVRGSINLRGRIVTVVDVRVRLGLAKRAIDVSAETPETPEALAAPEAESDGETESDAEATPEAVEAPKAQSAAEAEIERVKRKQENHMMGVTVEHKNELYTLLVDSVGDVISLGKDGYEGNPSTLDPVWREVASGVYRLEGKLMVVLDVERLLSFAGEDSAE